MVEESEPDQRDAEVARGFQMIAGEDAEPTGVHGERLGEAELRAEVRDEVEFAFVPQLEPMRCGERTLHVVAQRVQRCDERGIGSQGVEALL